MTEQPVRNQIVHRWYTRPVLFVADVNRALRFYVDMLDHSQPLPIAMPGYSHHVQSVLN